MQGLWVKVYSYFMPYIIPDSVLPAVVGGLWASRNVADCDDCDVLQVVRTLFEPYYPA